MDEQQSVAVYPIEDPATLASRARDVAVAVLGPELARATKSRFLISDVDGFISYANSDLLWDNRASGLPSLGLIPKLADGFRARASTALDAIGLPHVLPIYVDRPAVTAAVDPMTNQAAHWIVRYAIRLPTMTMPSRDAPASSTGLGGSGAATNGILPIPALAPVAGAGLELRFGPGGKVAGIDLRWRRPAKPVRRPLHIPPIEPSTPPSKRAAFSYLLGGANEPDTFLAPYFIVSAIDGEDLFPATDHSLLANCSVEYGTDSLLLTARIEGGTGSYRYLWAYWDLTGNGPLSPQVAGTSPSLQLPAGTYNVILDVEDVQTGALRRTQTLVYPASVPEAVA